MRYQPPVISLAPPPSLMPQPAIFISNEPPDAIIADAATHLERDIELSGWLQNRCSELRIFIAISSSFSCHFRFLSSLIASLSFEFRAEIIRFHISSLLLFLLTEGHLATPHDRGY